MNPSHPHSSRALPEPLRWAVEAAQAKQAAGVVVLDLGELGAFTDYFLVCSAASARQLGAVRDAIEEKLHQHHIRPAHHEGRGSEDWVLLDYGAFIVHILSERARLYYDLERLWRAAPRIEFTDRQAPHPAEGHRQ